MNVAVIPARSGSKGIINKNTLELWSIPILGWAILCARVTHIFDRIIISTDSEEYASLAKKYGAEVPYLRPKELSGDAAVIYDVLEDLYQNEGVKENWQCISLLEPTCPLRHPNHLIEMYRRFKDDSSSDAMFAISALPKKYHPIKQLHFDDGEISFYTKQNTHQTNRQAYGQTYARNGVGYMFNVNKLKNKNFRPADNIRGYLVNENLINLDDNEDVRELRNIEKTMDLPDWYHDDLLASQK